MGEVQEKQRVEHSEVLEECDRFEAELAELRAAWEQYFLGLERRPPIDRHEGLKRHAQRLRSLWVRQTAARFRVQAVIQKYATYERLWQRTLQEIENGTYKRDLHRAQRHATVTPIARAAAAEPREVTPEVTPEEADALLSDAFDGLDAPNPSARPRAKPLGAPLPPVPRPAAPAAADRVRVNGDAHDIPDSKLRAVYDAYVAARKRCNEDVSKMSFEQVAKNLRKQVPELMKKHNARAVEFKVVIREGKAVLRAVPKDG